MCICWDSWFESRLFSIAYLWFFLMLRFLIPFFPDFSQFFVALFSRFFVALLSDFCDVLIWWNFEILSETHSDGEELVLRVYAQFSESQNCKIFTCQLQRRTIKSLLPSQNPRVMNPFSSCPEKIGEKNRVKKSGEKIGEKNPFLMFPNRGYFRQHICWDSWFYRHSTNEITSTFTIN